MASTSPVHTLALAHRQSRWVGPWTVPASLNALSAGLGCHQRGGGDGARLPPAKYPTAPRTKAQSASAVLTDLAEHGSPHPPLVIIHGPSLAHRATKDAVSLAHA